MFRSMTSNNAAWPPPPPADETESDKVTRLEAEREAKRISDEIDHALEQERQEIRKRRPQTKILLLGQSESGKSTMIKNFQLKFCPSTFLAETEAWRTIIHLNLVRYVNYILELLSTPAAGAQGRGHPDKDSRVLQIRLSPLKHVEAILTRAISGESFGVSSPIGEKAPAFPCRSTEVCIRGGTAWKSLVRGRESLGSSSEYASRSSIVVDELEDARRILDACKDDIVALGKTRAGEKRDLDHAWYFLNNAARVADIKYMPTVEDILRARLRTIGVEEYRMPMETSAMEKGVDWLFYDVGGARSQRTAWAPYFDDVNAVIFLCPISCFDQQLEEDAMVNRLTDSLDLWTSVCKNKLLANAIFILLLNKADLLHAKLKAGIMFEDFVPSYRGRPNKLEHVGEYLREHMKTAHRSYSPKKRPLHVHVTCAIDTKLMSDVLNDIRDAILITVLRQTTFL